MKIVFFGTPQFVLPVLTTLHKRFVTGPGKTPIAAVVTQSPKPMGRKQIPTYTPIDSWAHEHKVPIYYSSKELINDRVSADLGVLASYGEILRAEILELFPHGILNIHPSLLPKLRGASPIQGAIITDGNKTGVSIIKMDKLLDHGPIVSQFKEDILPNDTSETLRTRLFDRSGEVLAELVEPYLRGKITPHAQKDAEATFTRTMSKEDGFIDPKILDSAVKGELPEGDWQIKFIKDFSLKASPQNIERFIRAMTPWPGVWTRIQINESKETKRLKILSAYVEGDKLTLDSVQLEGKNPVPYRQFLLAYKNPLNPLP